LAIALAACGGSQSSRTETASEEPVPAYSTSPTRSTSPTSAAGPTTSGGMTTTGSEHTQHGGEQHVMPDGGVMSGAQHGEGATHVMPDGTVMPGASHGTTK
jgi:hypothetical protein